MASEKSMITGVLELPDGQAVCRVAAGARLTEAAEAAGVVLDVSCGGAGTCGGCAVDLIAGAFADMQGRPLALDAGPRRVLGCRTRALGDFRVRVPSHSLVKADEKVLVDFDHLPAWVLGPAVRKQRLVMAPPVLTDQAGDIERIREAMGERGGEEHLDCTLAALREAPLACRQGNYDVTATVSQINGKADLTRIEPGDTTGRLFGVAIDIGTTTVVSSLVDLTTGRIVDSASSYNQQVRRVNDVAGRITAASTPEGLEELRRLVVNATINRQIGLLVAREGIAAEDIARVSIAGNTVMTHLLLGIDPAHLGAVPFQSASNKPPSLPAAAVGLAVHPAAAVDLAPSRAAYIGGDITADLVACGLAERAATSLLVDIGTNAEIVVGNRDRMVACAAPAGPAFEGQSVSCGMRASDGAIDTLRIDPATFDCTWTVLGGGAPVGLCGSALISFIGQAWRAGLLTAAGRFDRDAAGDRVERIAMPDGSEPWGYVIAAAERTDDKLAPIVITEADIAILLQAKGVIYAGIQIALKHLGKRLEDLDTIYLAGGFARHIDLPDAVALGLLPDVPLERFRFIGNGSLAGAYLRLIDTTFAGAMARVAARPEVIELNLDPEFEDAYMMAMFLP
ncbi:MAG: ATP-binding protein [Planctomycetes bacterium]|nr:ATP-binding protein [Planctomycetota bacterium]